MEISLDVIAYIVSFGLGVLTTYFAEKYLFAKDKLSAFANLISALVESLKDDKITAEELDNIISSFKKLIGE
jgi:hypothetical protein